MTLKKSLIAASGVVVIGMASLGVIGSVVADTNQNTLAEKIASRFNLNQNEVQAVFDEYHEQKHAERQQKLDEKLSQAVSDGKITEEQKAKILSKIEELKSERDANRDKVKDMSKEERKAFMNERRDELEQWLQDNGMPKDLLRVLMPHRHGGPGSH